MHPIRREIYPLTSLRFFAAALVVFEHTQMLPGLEWLGLKSHLPGLAGVRIFFVLSGFILSYTYWHRDWSFAFAANLKDFYWSRFARIYPLHWLMFLLALPLGLNSNTARVSVASFPWLLTLTDRLWPGYYAGSPPVKAAWTLSCEVLFYLLTPFLFWFLARRKKPLLAGFILSTILTGIIYLLVVSWPGLNWTAYIELPQFLLGIIGFHLTCRVDFSRWANLLIAGGLVLLAGTAYNSEFLSPMDMINWLAYAPGALLLVIGCATCTGAMRDFLSRPFLVLLGHASYALYLLHDPALRYLKVALNRMDIVLTLPAGLFTAGLMFCLMTAASIFCFKAYENPVRLKLRSLLAANPALSARKPA